MEDPIGEAATKLANETDTDILLYSGDIERVYDDKFLDLLEGCHRRKNVLLLLCTNGGSPDAAYRIARALQAAYTKFTVLVAGRCKSAGTLLAMGAHELALTDHAELGPLDVQLGKKDELWETDSGLTVVNSLTELEAKAFELFEKTFMRIKVQSDGRITFKTATQIATELAKGVVAPIMAQIDPMHVGEVSRAMKIGKEYGLRLAAESKNLHSGSLDKLVDKYPSHGFVIDRKEAKELFNNVRGVTGEEAALIHILRAVLRHPKTDDPILFFASNQRKEAAGDGNNTKDAKPRQAANGKRTPTNTGTLGSEESARPGDAPQLLPKTGTN